MSEFVAEFRPKQHYHACQPSHSDNGGFVASFGANSKSSYSVSSCHSTLLPEAYPSHCSTSSSPRLLCPQSPYSPDSCCSPPHADPMSVSCGEGYSDEVVYDMLSKKRLPKPEMEKVLENSIIKLAEKLLHGHSLEKVEGYLTITLSGDDFPLNVDLGRRYNNVRKVSSDFEMRLKELAGTRGDSPRSVSSDEWMGGLSPEVCLRADARHGSTSPAAYSPRTMSPFDHGMSRMADPRMPLSTESQVLRVRSNFNPTPSMNAALDSDGESCEEAVVVDGESCEEAVVVDETDKSGIDDEEESPLVIDTDTQEIVASKMKESEMADLERERLSDSGEETTDKEVSMESESEYCSASTSSSSDSDDSCGPKVVVDTECPETVPGDSGRSSDIAVTSQSMVVQLPEGIVCKGCQQILSDPKDVVAHAREKHGVFCCDVCFKTFTAKNNLKRHTRLHTGQRPYRCTQCHQRFARRDDLKGHMLRHDYTKPFRCSLCQKGYTDKACVKNHMSREHGSRRLIVCPQCGESFDNDEAFSTHKQTHPELQKYSCEECLFIGTNKLMTMKHRLIHTHKLFSCKPCNAYFPDPFNYTSHVRTHKAQTNFTKYTCCFCDTILPTYEQFVRHEYSHAQGKSYSCDSCSKQFNSKASAQEHALTHKDGQEPSVSIVEDEVNSPSHLEHSPPSLNIPTIVLSEPDTMPPREEMLDGVLDLSMKKSSMVSQMETDGQSLTSAAPTSPALHGPDDYSAPRNGCVSGSPVRVLVGDVSAQGSATFASADRMEEPVYGSVFRTSEETNIVSNLPAFDRLGERQLSPRPRSTEAPQKESSHRRPSLLVRSLSGHHAQNLVRFNPYKRNKIVDFASKFLAARGHQSGLLVKKGRTVLKPVLSEDTLNVEKSQRSFLETTDACMVDSKHPENIVFGNNSIVEGNKNSTNPQLIPTFIKSEPIMFDTDHATMVPSVTPDSGSQSDHHQSQGGQASHRVTQVCGQCKEEFCSFPELESHSVVVHKRYLCEYCGKSFSARPNRDRHVRYHTGERPYKCDLCEMAFFRGDDLKYHRTTRHPTAQPFVCTRCSASFTWQKDLERHIRQSKCKA